MADARSILIEVVAEEFGVPPLDDGEVDAVLSLAGAAAHGAGDRTAAPLCCYLAGLAAGTAGRAETLERMRAFVTAVTGETLETAS
jgi:hypothetical protein